MYEQPAIKTLQLTEESNMLAASGEPTITVNENETIEDGFVDAKSSTGNNSLWDE